jgi:hypothetical protein
VLPDKKGHKVQGASSVKLVHMVRQAQQEMMDLQGNKESLESQVQLDQPERRDLFLPLDKMVSLGTLVQRVQRDLLGRKDKKVILVFLEQMDRSESPE